MDSFCKIEISNLALKHNYALLASRLNKQAKIIAVIKADAYMHGANFVKKSLQNLGCKMFAVASDAEVAALKVKNEISNVVVLAFPRNLEWCIRQGIAFSVCNIAQCKMANEIACLLKATAHLHIKTNTGMNRYGTKHKTELKSMLQLCESSKYLVLKGVYTHFYAPSAEHIALRQAKLFAQQLSQIPKNLNPIVHIGGHGCLKWFKNDAFSFLLSQVHYVRVGLALYGYGQPKLKKAMQVVGQIVQLQPCKAGEVVGYGGANHLEKNCVIAVVPFGYADGMPRGLGNHKGFVTIKGKLCPIVGNVCMDAFMADVTSICDVKVQEKVVIMRDASVWARALNTISYEVLTNIKPLRVPRVYKKS